MTITKKINELLDINKIEPTYNFDLTNENNITNIMNRQKALIAEIKELARTQNTIFGRTVEIPIADSYALYLVTKIKKTTVQLSWIRYGDAWVDYRLGYQGDINKTYVQEYINTHDQLVEQQNNYNVQNID